MVLRPIALVSRKRLAQDLYEQLFDRKKNENTEY